MSKHMGEKRTSSKVGTVNPVGSNLNLSSVSFEKKGVNKDGKGDITIKQSFSKKAIPSSEGTHPKGY